MSYHFNELVSWHKCRLQHHYQYVQRYAPLRKPEPLDFGQMVHAGLETYYKDRDMAIAEESIIQYIANQWAALKVNLGQYEPEESDLNKYRRFQSEGQKMLKLYARYADKDDFTVLALEQELPVAGVPDLVRTVDMITLKDETRYAWEHKTTSKDRVGFLRSLSCSVEPALTCLAANTNWIIYNCLNKSASSKEMFWRETLYVSDEQKDIATRWANASISEIKYSEARPIWDSFICSWCSFEAACACQITGGDVDYILRHNYCIKSGEER